MRLLSIILMALLPLATHALDYEIISQSDLSGLDFSQLRQDSESTVRLNNDGTEAVISYDGSRPATLSGITALTKDTRTEHSNAQVKILVSVSGETGWAE